MAFIVGTQSIVLFNEFDLSAFFDKLDPNREGEALDSSTFGNTFKTFCRA